MTQSDRVPCSNTVKLLAIALLLLPFGEELLGHQVAASFLSEHSRKAPGNVVSSKYHESSINVTKLDCGIRSYAWEVAKTFRPGDPETQRHVYDALRLSDLCRIPDDTSADAVSNKDDHHGTQNPSKPSSESKAAMHRLLPGDELECGNSRVCIYVVPSQPKGSVQSRLKKQSPGLRSSSSSVEADGSFLQPFTSIHEAIEASRVVRSEDESRTVSIVLREGIHSLGSKMIRLTKQDSGLSIVGYPGENAWFSGGLPLENVVFEQDPDTGIHVGNLTELLEGHERLPPLLSLFATDRRFIRARYPNANPETDQWGFASLRRHEYSLANDLVVEWHRPPPSPKGPPKFTLVDFWDSPPPSIPAKNDSKQRGYNWYASGKGGACSDVWGDEADSYWCSNASQGGWAEVDQECAVTGQVQLPIGFTYNISALDLQILKRAENALQGGIVHAWHSQSWAMHMFEITKHVPSAGVVTLAPGGGRQGGRNWCRCDQCTYAGGFCGQHQSEPWKDTRLISGSWMVENIRTALDQAGEYYFDSTTKLLYVKVNATEDLSDLRVALLEQILDIRDGASNITIDNIGFRDTAPTYHPSYDWSAPSGGDWSLHRGGAIFLEHVQNITIKYCLFRRLDGNAIFLSRRTRKVIISGNRFEWLGENAIATWGDTDGYDATKENFPMYTKICYNVMRELGIYEKQSSAVGLAKAAFTTIHRNIMFNMPRAAINFNDMVGGGDWVKSNLIFNTCRESGDHGPINSWDRQPYLTTLRDGKTKSFDPVPRVIEGNFIIANYGASQGVDNDDGSSWFHIHHNLFYSADGFKMDYGGHDSVFEDNLILSYPYDGSRCYGMGGFFPGHGDILRRNRCLVGLGHAMGSGCGDPSCASPVPESDSSQEIVGHLFSGCKDTPVLLMDNQYYTPDGEVKVGCGDNNIPLKEVQETYGVEQGSSAEKLPNEATIIEWARSLPISGEALSEVRR